MHPDDTILCLRCRQHRARSAFGPWKNTVDHYCLDCRAAVTEKREAKARELDDAFIPNPGGLCLCGCGTPTPIAKKDSILRGHRKGHPTPYLSGHAAGKNPGYVVDPVTGCWNFQGAKDRNGYGITKLNGKTMTAHRAYYIRLRGPIPNGMELDHVVCHNVGCINPNHVEPVTKLENLRRAGKAKLTWEDVDELRRLAGTVAQAQLARRFGLTSGHVSNILAGRCWREENRPTPPND